MAYATSDEIAQFTQEPTSLDAAGWEILLTAASRLFDKLCEVSDEFFAVNTEGSLTRTFYGDGTAYLKIPPFIEVEDTPTVTSDDYTITADDWIVQGQYLVWLDRTQRLGNVTSEDRYTGWKLQVPVAVTASWGWDAIPADVKMATMQIALSMWRQTDPAFAVVSNTEKAVTPELPVFVTQIAEKYRKIWTDKAVF